MWRMAIFTLNMAIASAKISTVILAREVNVCIGRNPMREETREGIGPGSKGGLHIRGGTARCMAGITNLFFTAITTQSQALGSVRAVTGGALIHIAGR